MKLLRHTSLKQVAELRMFLHKTKNIHEYERARAILKRIEGQSREVIAEVFDIHIKTLDSWTTRFTHYGIGGIKAGNQPGNHHGLRKEQKEVLRQVLFVERKEPQDLGYEGRFWTTETLRAFVKDQYGVVYKARFSYQRLFAFIGFTNHKPVKVNKRRNEKARKRFIEMVKKNLNCTQEHSAWCW